MKDLWRGAFVIGNTVSILYAYAHSEKQAKAIMCRRIAKRDSVSIGVVMDTAKPEITLEMKITEDHQEGLAL